jgi:hypothetical protein
VRDDWHLIRNKIIPVCHDQNPAAESKTGETDQWLIASCTFCRWDQVLILTGVAGRIGNDPSGERPERKCVRIGSDKAFVNAVQVQIWKSLDSRYPFLVFQYLDHVTSRSAHSSLTWPSRCTLELSGRHVMEYQRYGSGFRSINQGHEDLRFKRTSSLPRYTNTKLDVSWDTSLHASMIVIPTLLLSRPHPFVSHSRVDPIRRNVALVLIRRAHHRRQRIRNLGGWPFLFH